jgi:hypothetical protein
LGGPPAPLPPPCHPTLIVTPENTTAFSTPQPHTAHHLTTTHHPPPPTPHPHRLMLASQTTGSCSADGQTSRGAPPFSRRWCTQACRLAQWIGSSRRSENTTQRLGFKLATLGPAWGGHHAANGGVHRHVSWGSGLAHRTGLQTLHRGWGSNLRPIARLGGHPAADGGAHRRVSWFSGLAHRAGLKTLRSSWGSNLGPGGQLGLSAGYSWVAKKVDARGRLRLQGCVPSYLDSIAAQLHGRPV